VPFGLDAQVHKPVNVRLILGYLELFHVHHDGIRIRIAVRQAEHLSSALPVQLYVPDLQFIGLVEESRITDRQRQYDLEANFDVVLLGSWSLPLGQIDSNLSQDSPVYLKLLFYLLSLAPTVTRVSALYLTFYSYLAFFQ